MSGMVSIIISSFLRPHLLKWGLFSLAQQIIPFQFETLVINDGIDDETAGICQEYQKKLNLKYFFTGQRNQASGIKWRVPGFAVNIGVKQSAGPILILSCAEMFHLNGAIAKLTYPVLENKKRIGIPLGKDDRSGAFLNRLQENNGRYPEQLINYLPDLNTKLPFLISVSRDEFLAIGGYDEDFTGVAFDDNDLVDRLCLNGCSYCRTDAKTVHLFHPRYVYATGESPEWRFNRDLYLAGKNKIIRNENREWGKL